MRIGLNLARGVDQVLGGVAELLDGREDHLLLDRVLLQRGGGLGGLDEIQSNLKTHENHLIGRDQAEADGKWERTDKTKQT